MTGHLDGGGDRPPDRLSTPLERRADLTCLALLGIVWLLIIVAVNPIGDFPLNDDWAYASAVRTLVETGEFRLSGWTAANFIAQLLWGALFCLPFGFSFTALRLSTLLLSFIGIAASYGLLREVRARPSVALFGALTLALGPLYLALSFTFMTDVPFAATSIASSWLLVRGIRRDRPLTMAAGLGLAFVAILIRQTGLALPIAFAVAYVTKHGLRPRPLTVAVAAIAAGLAVQFGYQLWLHWLDRVPLRFGNQILTIKAQLALPWKSIAADAATILFVSLVYLGAFLLPFLSVFFLRYWRVRPRMSLLGLAALTIAVTAVLRLHHWLMPLHGNVLTKSGIAFDAASMPYRYWALITLAGVFGALLLVVALICGVYFFLSAPSRGNAQKHRAELAFALTAIGTSFAPMMLCGLGAFGFYDRYLIIFVPWLMLLLICLLPDFSLGRGKLVAVVGIVTILPMGLFSMVVTHDYMAVNRVRWTALDDVMRRYNVGPDRIDGGFEFNGWYLYDDDYVVKPSRSWWWVDRDDFVLQFSSVRNGYERLAEYPVRWWAPWGKGSIIVQRRLVPADGRWKAEISAKRP